MITRQFAFFCFMLSWSILARIGMAPPIGLILLPLVWIVSGKKYVAYFFIINIIITAPNLIQMTNISTSMQPFWNLEFKLLNPNLQNQAANQFIYNMTGISVGGPTHAPTNIIYILVALISATIAFMILIAIIYAAWKGIKMYIKLFRMIRNIIHSKSFNAI